MPKSELYRLLEEMGKATGKDKQELLMKVQKSYAETDGRLRACMGEEAYVKLAVFNREYAKGKTKE
jgi:hypothetical protein